MPVADFSSARRLLNWAREDVQELESASRAFLSGDAYEIVQEIDSEAGETLVKLRTNPVPDYIIKLASHALWDTKHALDHAACAAVRAFRGDSVEDIHFPIASHPNDLEHRLTHIPKNKTEPRYPAVLHQTFRDFEPYPTSDKYTGGGDEFVALSKLANDTKHSIALGTLPTAVIAAAKGVGMPMRIFQPGRWDSAKQEFTLAAVRPTPKGEVNLEIACYISFRDSEVLRPYSAADILNAFSDMVTTITNDLEKAVTG